MERPRTNIRIITRKSIIIKNKETKNNKKHNKKKKNIKKEHEKHIQNNDQSIERGRRRQIRAIDKDE